MFLVVGSPLAGQSTYEARHKAYFDDISKRGINTGQHDGPHRAGRTGFWTTQGKLQRGNESSGVWNDLILTVADADGSADANGANGGFSGWPGMDTYLRWQHRFPQNVKDAYRTEYTTMPTYGRGSTPNQRIMWAAACKLACETWGTAAVTSVSNAANKYGDPTGKAYMMAICDRTVKYNFEERWAKHYLQYTLGPLRSIADLSNDPVLANKARMTWNWGWMDIASFSFHGRWAIPAGRGSMTQDGNSSDISEFGSWLMFGGEPRAGTLDMDQVLPYTQPKVGQAHLVTYPPILPEMLDAATDRSRPYTRRGMARVHETQLATSHITRDWALYSQLECDTTLNADGTLKIKDLENNGVPSNDWSSERWAVLWDETGPAGLTMKPPTGYGWAQGSGLGPHEDVVQHEGTVVGVIHFPSTWTWKYTRDYLPVNTLAVINDAATTGRLYLHYSKVLVAITRSDIGNFTWPPASQTYSDKRGFAVECASLSEYPQSTAAARLAAFKADIEAHPVDTSRVNDPIPTMKYTTRDGTVMEITYGQGGKIDGDPVDYTGWPLHESPWSYQAQMGNMWVFGRDRHLIWNYQDWTEREDRRPVAVASGPIVSAGGAPVDVDLSAWVSDPDTASADLFYRIDGSETGQAVLLGDGKTARFTPAADFSGVSGFTFTAGGEFPDHRFVFHYDFEQPAAVTGGVVLDQSTNNRHASASVGGLASLAGQSDTPPVLGARSARSLRLDASAFGSAKLSRQIHPATLDFSNHDWTFATWFKRSSHADEDFLFYIGQSDGNSGSTDELQLAFPAHSKTLALKHWTQANVLDVNLGTPAIIEAGQWYHVAVQFDRLSHRTGVMKLFLNGKLQATSPPVTWTLNQTGPVFIGGPALNTVLTRNFNGWLDDVVLARGELSDADIGLLATTTASHLGGVKLTRSVDIVSAPPAPSGLSAIAGSNVIQLSWTASHGAAGYTVKRATDAAGPFTTLATNVTGTGYTDATAAFGTVYFYHVTATNGAGESTASHPASARLPDTDPSIWNSGAMAAWIHGTRISFPGYADSESLQNIPVLIRLDSENVPGFSYSQFAFSNGADLRFTDSTGTTELPWEIETWNPGGTSLVWVRVPTLAKSTDILAFWGNTAAVATAEPDSLPGLALWLKADAITGMTDGATISTWSDSSANGRHASVLAGTPTFESGEINGHPVVRFPAGGESGFQFATLNAIRTVFWVVKESSPGMGFLLGDDNTYHFHRGTGGKLWDSTHASANVRNGTTKLNGLPVNGTATALGGGWNLVSVVTSGNCEASRLSKDRGIAARSWSGDVAEVMVFDRALTSNEEQLVGAYLARKYALSAPYAGAVPAYAGDGSVWTGGYAGVWHLNSTAVVDSTSPAQNTTSNAVPTSAGKVGSALLHNGSSQHAIIPHATELNLSNNYEISGWFKLSPADKPSAGNYRTLFTKETDAGTRNWWISINADGRLWWKSSAGIDVTSPADLADGEWHCLAAVHDGTTARMYIDGVEVATGAAPANEELTTWAVRLGSENSTRWFKGTLDEFRLSKVQRGAAWVRAVYENIQSPGFVRSAPVAGFSAAFPPMVANLPATQITGTSAVLNGSLIATGGSTTNVIVYHGATDGGTVPANWDQSLVLGEREVGGFGAAITGLAPGTMRYFRAHAANATGGTWAPATSGFITPTAAPGGLAAIPSAGQATITWNATPGASGYRLKRASTSGGPYTTILSGILGTTAVDPTAQVGSTAYYVVSATNPGGESADSGELSLGMLAAPAMLTATAGNGLVQLSWSPVPNAAGYTIRRATSPDGPFAVIASGVSASSRSDTTAVNGIVYYYVVNADGGGYESAPSPVASAMPSASMATPVGLAVTPSNGGAILTWNAVEGATSYAVKRSSTDGGPYATVAGSLLAPAFTNTGLTNGQPYFYVVTAFNGTIESAASTQVGVVPATTPTTFTTASAGQWSTANWSPMQPVSAFETTIVFTNAGPVSSQNNLGLLLANKVNLTGGAVNLSGDALFLAGTAPAVNSTANVAHVLAGTITLDAATVFNIPSNATTVSGTINGNGGITKTGAGSLVLTGANSNTGPSTVSAGVLNVRHPEALGSSTLTVANGASLELQDNITLTGHRVTLTGQGSGTGGVMRNLSGNNTWAGEITAVAAGGVTRISSDAGKLTLAGEINQDNGSTDQLVFQGDGATVVTGAIDGNSRVTRSTAGNGVVSLLGDNTYTGQTLINGGILEINSISSLIGAEGDEEVAINASSLGIPTTVANGTINIGNTATPATLRFIGPTTRTDRVLNLAGTTGGATIEQNGSGKLTFSSNLTATGAGSKTLTLSGSSEGFMAGAISDHNSTHKTSLVKSGSGWWTLGGANTYTGGTTVNGGTLLLSNASIAAGANVLVTESSAFGGTGTVAPNATVNGTLVLQSGVLNLAGNLGFGPAARVRWHLSENSGTSGFGQAVASNAPVANGAVVDVSLDTEGSQVDFSDPFWTSPRSWPVLSASALSGAFSLGTISPDSHGHPSAGYGAFSIAQSANGATLNWTPLTPIEQWRFTHFGVTVSAGMAADGADPDNDGVGNLLEFTAATVPTDAASLPVFVWNQPASGNWTTPGQWNLGIAPVSNPATKVDFLGGIAGIAAGAMVQNNDNLGVFSLNSLRLAGSGSGAISNQLTGGMLRFHANGEIAPLLRLNAFSTNFNHTVANAIELAANLGIDGANSGNFTLSGPISGIGGIHRTGEFSRLVLGGTNTYEGGTTLSAGVTAISNAANLGAVDAPLVLDGGTLQILGNSLASITALNRPVQFTPDKAITLDIQSTTHGLDCDVPLNHGTGGLTKLGGGTLILSRDNSFTGPTTLTAGTLSISSAGQLGDPTAPMVFNGGTLRVNGTLLANLSDLGRPVSFAATKTVGIDIAEPAHVFSMDFPLDQTTGGLAKFGGGVLDLTAGNTFTGNITIAGGVLRVSQASALGGVAKDIFCSTGAARLELDGAGGDIVLPATTRILTSGAQPTGSLRNVSGNNVVAGTLLLTTGAGNSQIVSDGGTLHLAGMVTTSPSTGARTLFLGGSGNGIVGSETGAIQDSGTNIISVTKNGSGSWEMRGNHTYRGTTTVTSGTLVLSGSIGGSVTTGNGVFAPSGTPSVGGGLTMTSGGTLSVRIGGGTPGSGYDQLSVAGNVALGGTLDLIPSGPIATGQAFTVINVTGSGLPSGAFLGLPQNATFPVAPNQVWQINYAGGDGNDVVLTLASLMTPIEAFRFQYFQTITNGGSAADGADPDGDGRSNLEEFNLASHPLEATAPDVVITRPSSNPITLAALEDALHLTAAISQTSATLPLAWTWSKVSGPGTAVFEDATSPATRVRFDVPGIHVLQATATLGGTSASATLTVRVGVPDHLALRQVDNGYSHAATFIRGDSPAWNSGARDQILVGRNNGGMRALFAFDLSGVPDQATITTASFDLWIAMTGSGSVNAMQLRPMLREFNEGNGNGSSSANGSGSGADWNSRTGPTTANLWGLPGGQDTVDYSTTVIGGIGGFNAGTTAAGTRLGFTMEPAFLAEANNARAGARQLRFVLSMTGDTSTGSLFARFASDDHANPEVRPLLTLGYTLHPAPVIETGLAPAVVVNSPAVLAGTVTGATSLQWSMVSGPGTAVFTDPSQATTGLTLSSPGTYLIRLVSTNEHGTVSRDLLVEAAVATRDPAVFADWQALTWPEISNPDTIGANADPDRDGMNNRMEWALHLAGAIPDKFQPAWTRSSGMIEYHYVRRIVAPGQASYHVEWSDSLFRDWSEDGVTSDPPVQVSPTSESVRVLVPAGADSRFIRLRVTVP